MKKIFTLFLIVILGFSQEENIASDYPGQATTPLVLPQKRFQVEMGSTINFSKPALYNIPGLILRYGINKNIEIRYEGGNFMQPSNAPEIDNALGTKITFVNKPKIQFGLIHLFTEASYSNEINFGTRTFLSTVLNIWKLSIYNNLGYSVSFSGAKSGFYILGTSVALYEGFSLFGEIYNNVVGGVYTTPNVNGGLIYRVKKNIEVGAWSGYEILTSINYVGVSIGFYPVRKDTK